MDCVIPVRPGTNQELLFALRSIGANLPHDRVFLIGEPPRWVSNVEVIRRPRVGTKYATTTAHVRHACEHPDISDPWILLNDDMYITREITEVPTLHRGPIAGVIAEYHQKGIRSSRYVQGMVETLALLTEHGYERPLSYELHVPLVVSKGPMLEALDLAEASGIEVPHKRSMFGAIAGIGGEFSYDVKMIRPGRLPDSPFLSSTDASFARTVSPVLRRLFADPGPYEPAGRRTRSVASR